MKNWMNLYTFLIDHVALSYCFGDRVATDIKYGLIKVNNAKPDNINMELKINDVVTVDGVEYKIKQEHLIN